MAYTLLSEPDDQELLAYLDGEASPQVTAHVEQCPRCRERIQRLARLQDHLTARLYRATCPSSLELGEYHLGVLPREQAAAVAQHLAECPHCTREVAQLKDYLAEVATTLEPSPLAQVKERVRVLIARLVSEGRERSSLTQQTLAPAYAGVRGAEQEPLLYQAEDIQIVVEIQDDAEQPDRKVVLGLIVGMAPSGAKVYLRQADRHIAEASIDELGNFVISDLAPGSYDLILSGPEVEIHIQELQVGAS